MKNLMKFLSLAFVAALVFSCDAEEASQTPAGIGSDTYKPTVSVTADMTGDVDEGMAATFTLNTDRAIAYDIFFTAVLVSGDATDSDLVIGSARLPKYSTTTDLVVDFNADGVPELDETAVITIQPDGVDSNFWVNDASDFGTYSYTIKSPVDPNDLIVALEWDLERSHDLDMFSVSAQYGAWDQQWTGDHPEVKNLIWGVDPDGTYYLGIDPYDVEDGVTEFWYRWSLGQPDGTVTVIEDMFDYANRDSVYEIDSATSGTPSYRLVTVEKTGTTFVATGL